MPKLSGTDTIPPKRYLNIGRWQIPLSKPRLELMRKSKSFWKIVSDRGIFSSVLRVPYTYPPEKLYGMMLAGLGTPDLRGTQGSFSFYSEKKAVKFDIWEGTAEELIKKGDNHFEGGLKGPGSPFVKGNPPLTVPFTIKVYRDSSEVVFSINRQDYRLQANRLSEWIKVEFRVGFIKIRGIVQLVLKELDPLSLYISPINIDPENPTMPVSFPKIYSAYLAKSAGSFATLGMAEDTTAVNEGVLSEEAFLQQVYLAQAERERIFFDTFKKQKNGLIVQVFEATDRVQHMFWKQMVEGSSASESSDTDTLSGNAIRESYRRMDDFLGRLLPLTGENDLLMVVSDHGFNAFNREFHLNSWLHQQGYLVLKEGKQASGKFFADVDWSRTKAYGQGLNGLYLNMKGRESEGVVHSEPEAGELKAELKSKLQAVTDETTGEKPIGAVFLREEIYRGPYLSNAPDLQIGYNVGYRVSWESTVNYVGSVIFSDNSRAWSGDHAFTRDRIPGIFFANQNVQEKKPTLQDISPTVLAAFGLQKPTFIDGRDLEVGLFKDPISRKDKSKKE